MALANDCYLMKALKNPVFLQWFQNDPRRDEEFTKVAKAHRALVSDTQSGKLCGKCGAVLCEMYKKLPVILFVLSLAVLAYLGGVERGKYIEAGEDKEILKGPNNTSKNTVYVAPSTEKGWQKIGPSGFKAKTKRLEIVYVHTESMRAEEYDIYWREAE